MKRSGLCLSQSRALQKTNFLSFVFAIFPDVLLVFDVLLGHKNRFDGLLTKRKESLS